MEETVEKERAKAEAAAKEQFLAPAGNFKNINLPVVDIAKATGLSVEEIER